ncbi:helix-turn-helix domain-containing protein [Paenibacillus sp. LK1]|uniref:AlbA family DNA-binding domain-containing protein n=1 Tax=Paenibacillus sp. LK1 TaxID=2053014 RepID=UPI0015D4F16D|nr:ATP-binding protein [Paenibacillus sp. LK1]
MITKTDWTEQDIQQLIANQVKENINLDYKACASLKNDEKCKNELSKDVSAFANSDGGILIYGVIEKDNIAVKIDEGYDPNIVKREWIEDNIHGRIQRRIEGIRIFQVDLNETHPGRVIYVISIPQSLDGPHMANDHKYYKRFNFKSSPMEDYEVRDIRRRSNVPNVNLWFSIEDIEDEVNEKKLALNAVNTSSIPAEYYGVRAYIDNRIEITSKGEFMNLDSDFSFEREGEYISTTCYYKLFALPHNSPIWDGEEFNLTCFKFKVPLPCEGDYILAWTVSGPGFKKSDSEIITVKNRVPMNEGIAP